MDRFLSVAISYDTENSVASWHIAKSDDQERGGQYFISVNHRDFVLIPGTNRIVHQLDLSSPLNVQVRYIDNQGKYTTTPALLLDRDQADSTGVIRLDWKGGKR